MGDGGSRYVYRTRVTLSLFARTLAIDVVSTHIPNFSVQFGSTTAFILRPPSIVSIGSRKFPRSAEWSARSTAIYLKDRPGFLCRHETTGHNLRTTAATRTLLERLCSFSACPTESFAQSRLEFGVRRRVDQMHTNKTPDWEARLHM